MNVPFGGRPVLMLALGTLLLTSACGSRRAVPALTDGAGGKQTPAASVSAGVCAPPGAPILGRTCKKTGDCDAPLACVSSQCTRRKKAAVSETCAFLTDCEAGHPCIVGRCRETLSPPGGPCTTYADCEAVAPGTYCFQGACTTLGDGREGSFCELDEHCFEPLVCGAFRCESEKTAKKRTGKNGEACLTFAGCLSGFCVLGKCASKPLRAGKSCASDPDCASGLCFKGACRESLLTAGESCGHDSECESEACIHGACASLHAAAGEACDTDEDCALPSVCIAGACVESLSGEGGPCGADDDCVPGLACTDGCCRCGEG